MTAGQQEAAAFGTLLRRLRLAAGLTQEALAERAGLSERAVRRLEHDHGRVPRLYTVRLLAEALKLSPDEQSQLLEAARPASAGRESRASAATVPHPSTALFGREADVAIVKMQLDDSRLVTVSGPGGVGKTRLALAVARELMSRFDRIVYVELAPLRDPDHVVGAIAESLSIRGEGTSPLGTLVADELQSGRTLLVLDNMEHLMPARDTVLEILISCSELYLLITSREVLRVRGERVYTLSPLQIPEREADIELSPAVHLFLDRARAAGAVIDLDPAVAHAVAQICRRLDGLPLAIELAAAWAPALSPIALLERLTSRLPHLDRGPHDLPARQRTMRDTLAWSYDLLAPGEKKLFRRLAVFVGGCTLEAATAVCREGDQSEMEILVGLASLVDKSLLTAQEVAGGERESRFGTLETVREFADERLSESPEAIDLHQRRAAYFLALAAQAEQALSGPGQSVWLNLLDRELDNLRAVLDWARQTGDVSLGLELAGRLLPFWWARNHYEEARRWLDDLLSQAESARVPAAIHARALYAAGTLASVVVDRELPISLLHDALVLAREAGDNACAAATLRQLGSNYVGLGNYQLARELLDDALTMYRQRGDRPGECTVLTSLAGLARYEGYFDDAESLYRDTLTVSRGIGDDRRTAEVLARFGTLETERGRPGRSQTLFDEALALHRALGDAFGETDILLRSGEAAADAGEFSEAMARYEKCVPRFRELGSSYAVAYALIYQAESAAGLGDLARAEELAEESLGYFRRIRDLRSMGEALLQLANIVRLRQEHADALALYKECLEVHRDLNTRPQIALCLERMALLARVEGDDERVARLHGAASALHRDMGSEMAPADVPEYERCIATTRDRLGTSTFARYEAAGGAMGLINAVAFALAQPDNVRNMSS